MPKQIRTMLKDKIIRPSKSVEHAIIVSKKIDATGINYRISHTIDFKKLNDLTIVDFFPLPNIIDKLDQKTLNTLLH